MLEVLAGITGTPAPEGFATPEIQWVAIAPALALFAGAIVLLSVASLTRAKPLPGSYALFTITAAIVSLIFAVSLWERVQDDGRGPFTAIDGALGIDGFSVFFAVLISFSVVLTVLLADGYLRREGLDGPELYALLLCSASGGVIMAAANDLIVMFLGLEVLSIAAYIMAAMHSRRIESQEAGMKYFVLGAFSSAFFLYGIAFLYGATGTTSLIEMREFFATTFLTSNGLVLAGMAFLLVGFGFKVAAVPFHAWTPDVYQGAPSPVVAFMASAVKAAGFAGLLRVFFLGLRPWAQDWEFAIWGLSALTLVGGAVLAVVQTDVKRMLAYSSISHAGFVLVAVHASGRFRQDPFGIDVVNPGVSSALFYLAAYTIMIIGTFGVVTVAGRRGDAMHSLDDYRGLARRRPALALVFSVFLLAQAGIPLTVGFMAKFEVIRAAVEAESYWLAVVAMLSAVIAAFLYLRIMVSMYMASDEEADAADEAGPIGIPYGAALAITTTAALTLGFGFLPDRLVDAARDAAPALVAIAG